MRTNALGFLDGRTMLWIGDDAIDGTPGAALSSARISQLELPVGGGTGWLQAI